MGLNPLPGNLLMPPPPGGHGRAQVLYDETIDYDDTVITGGVPNKTLNSTELWGYNSTRLPRDPKNNCHTVAPWQHLRTNTVFEVAREAGLTTAYSDKHTGADRLRSCRIGGPSILLFLSTRSRSVRSISVRPAAGNPCSTWLASATCCH
jgi:hypothetical protein